MLYVLRVRKITKSGNIKQILASLVLRQKAIINDNKNNDKIIP